MATDVKEQTKKKKSVEELVQELSRFLNDKRIERKKIVDFFTLRQSQGKYLNLLTLRPVQRKTAHKMLFYNTEQKICTQYDDGEVFNDIVGIFQQLSYLMIAQPVPSPKSEVKCGAQVSTSKLASLLTSIHTKNNEEKREPICMKVRDRIFNRSGGVCYCCGVCITHSFFQCGHIIPHKFFGSCDESNLRAICQSCNDAMGAMHMHEYMLLNRGEENTKMSITERRYYRDLRTQTAVVLRLLKLQQLEVQGADNDIMHILTHPKKYYHTDRHSLVKECMLCLKP